MSKGLLDFKLNVLIHYIIKNLFKTKKIKEYL